MFDPYITNTFRYSTNVWCASPAPVVWDTSFHEFLVCCSVKIHVITLLEEIFSCNLDRVILIRIANKSASLVETVHFVSEV